MAFNASRNCWRLSVKLCSTRAESQKLINIAASPDRIWSINSPTCRLASSSRVGFTSVADMLAELSTRKMKRLPINLVPCQLGRSRAKTASAMMSNCRNSSRFRRSRCQMELTCRSSVDFRQR